MSKRKQKSRDSVKPAVQFSIEENAAELMQRYIDSNPPTDKDTQIEQDGSAKTSRKRRSRSGEPRHSIDLHGLTLAQAQSRVDQVFQSLLTKPLGNCMQVQVITGKGLHSGPGGGVLATHIHSYIRQRYQSYILQIDESPDDLRLNGIPIRGHFLVTLQI